MTGIEILTGVMRPMADVFDALVSQPQVGSYLRSCVTTQRLTHAYLFSGPAGCGKQQAACSLAQALLYGLAPETESARAQSEMIVRKSHPDVHWLTPEGAAGYVVDQVRQIIADFSVAPFSAPRKVYVISQADKLGASCANALLKALEEPPATVTFILLAKSAESVLTTIVDDLGFTDHSHFNKEFRQFAGMSPTEYLAHLREIKRTDFIRGYRAYHE